MLFTTSQFPVFEELIFLRIFEGLIEVNRIAVFRKKVNLERTISGDNNGMTLTVSRKFAKIVTVSRKSNHPMETLLFQQKLKKINK